MTRTAPVRVNFPYHHLEFFLSSSPMVVSVQGLVLLLGLGDLAPDGVLHVRFVFVESEGWHRLDADRDMAELADACQFGFHG